MIPGLCTGEEGHWFFDFLSLNASTLLAMRSSTSQINSRQSRLCFISSREPFRITPRFLFVFGSQVDNCL
ncbi:hypothetical protein E2C01_036391 [Portunus trituberculatus]|uniref:Uncharacterized protein n=1 Tax=Portunus trituberculatus TaxID=210409 RepID=A0A5B7F5M7_PORTR|nr:hypothetical protein [Portunus trituberculatus]